MSLTVQALTILHMIGAGLFIGASYDTYARLRYRRSRWITFIQDLSFWLACIAVVFIWLLFVNEGQVRFHIFLALLCGYAAYKALLQHLFCQMLESLIRFTLACARLLRRLFNLIVITPIKIIATALAAVMIGMATAIVYLGRQIFRAMRFILQPLWKGIKRMYVGVREKLKRKKKAEEKEDHLTDQERREAYMRELSRKNKRSKKGILYWLKKIFTRNK